MFVSKNFHNPKITVFDICQELKANLDMAKIQSEPSKVRLLIALLSTKLQNQFKMVTDFTNLDSRMKYQKNTFAKYVHKWRHISLIQKNTSEFIDDTIHIINLITPKRRMAI
jgi:hypothetical protein